MNMKSTLIAGVLAIFTISLASAKTYDITLNSAAKVGGSQLAAGEYKLKLDGNKATFINLDSNRQVTADVKVDTADKKYDVTTIGTTKNADVEQINAIELGGSKTKLEFGGL